MVMNAVSHYMHHFLNQILFFLLPETPSVLTVATPGTTTASGRPIEDGWITEEDGPSPTDEEHMIQEV